MNAPFPAPGTKRIRPGRRLSLRQVLDLQQVSHEAALGLQADFTSTTDRNERARVASAIANLAKGWVSLADAKREILGRPKAGSLKPERPRKKSKPLWAVPLADYAPVPAEFPPKPANSVHEVEEQPGEFEQTGPKPAAPAVPVAAKPTVPCPICDGGGTINVSGGARISCQVCRGTGLRS